MEGVDTVIIRTCPDVQSEGGLVFVQSTCDRRWSKVMSPHVALRLADTLRQAAYVALQAPPAPHCTVVKFKGK
jgi:hypothetical protein